MMSSSRPMATPRTAPYHGGDDLRRVTSLAIGPALPGSARADELQLLRLEHEHPVRPASAVVAGRRQPRRAAGGGERRTRDGLPCPARRIVPAGPDRSGTEANEADLHAAARGGEVDDTEAAVAGACRDRMIGAGAASPRDQEA